MHAHPEYVIGAIVQGCESLTFADAQFLLPVGSTLFIRPDEVHANKDETPFGYRVIYAHPETFRAIREGSRANSERADSQCDPFGVRRTRFSSSPGLYKHVLRSHRALIQAEGDALEQQSVFAELVGGLARAGLALQTMSCANARLANARLATARRRIDGDFREPISLDALAQIAGLSSFTSCGLSRRPSGRRRSPTGLRGASSRPAACCARQFPWPK